MGVTMAREEDMGIDLKYIDHLQKKNADDLAFYPLYTLEKALEEKQILSCEDNGDAAGYLWFGSIRPGRDVVIYQACVDYQSRRKILGWDMVRDLILFANAGGATGIRLRCASSSESNIFWQAIGFYCTKVSAGGLKRMREINHWRTDLQPTLFTSPAVTPSDKQIDLSTYNTNKKKGVEYKSRWARGIR